MARRKRTYRTPVVMTLAALAPSCVPGLSHDDDGTGGSYEDGNFDGYGAGGVGASQQTGGQASGGASSTGGASTGGTSSGGGTPMAYPECPSSDGSYGFTVPCHPSEQCQIEMDCTSGLERSFVFACAVSGDYWYLQTNYCSYPAEFCSRGAWDEAATCDSGAWMYQGQGGNPPGPCPEALPEEGGDCSAGAAFGGDRTACGYPCADGGGWTVTGCFGEMTGDPEYPYGPGTWQSDGACNFGGQGGAGP